MKNRKTTNKQERYDIVAEFAASGQSQLMWCQQKGIPVSTFARWLKEYKMAHEKVKFVSLSEKKAHTSNELKNTESICNATPIVIEIGVCKMHVPQEMAMTLLLQVMKVGSKNV